MGSMVIASIGIFGCLLLMVVQSEAALSVLFENQCNVTNKLSDYLEAYVNPETGELLKVNKSVKFEAKRVIRQPWTIFVTFKPKTFEKNDRVFCGGVLIDEDMVLTTASCFADSNKNDTWVNASEVEIEVGLGFEAINPYNSPDFTVSGSRNNQQKRKSVKAMIIHDDIIKLSSTQYANDIALLKLKEKVSTSEKIRPVCIADTENVQSDAILEIRDLCLAYVPVVYAPKDHCDPQSTYNILEYVSKEYSVNVCQKLHTDIGLVWVDDTFCLEVGGRIAEREIVSPKLLCDDEKLLLGSAVLVLTSNQWFMVGMTLYGPLHRRPFPTVALDLTQPEMVKWIKMAHKQCTKHDCKVPNEDAPHEL